MPTWIVQPRTGAAFIKAQSSYLRIFQKLLRNASLLSFALVCAFVPARAGQIDQATKGYLEGIWLIGKQPDRGPCTADQYDWATQWEFEFRKSGGRLMIFEPPDLFTPLAVPLIEKDGDRLIIWGQRRDGVAAVLGQIRLLPPNRIALLPIRNDGKGSEQVSSIAYRCGAPDRSVNASLSTTDLALLTPNLTLSRSFPVVEPDMSDRDLCNGKRPDRKRWSSRWIQFELLGPVHYWVLGVGIHREGSEKASIEFDLVRKVQRVDERTLKLTIQERIPVKKSKGWDNTENMGKTYDLTVINRGGRIEVPELSTIFVQCEANEPRGYGMHRP